MDDGRDHARVLWRSRRGMLELDLLLVDFAQNRYRRLPAHLQRQYRDLLHLDDPVLLDWLQGRTKPSGPFAEIVGAIAAFNSAPSRGHRT